MAVLFLCGCSGAQQYTRCKSDLVCAIQHNKMLLGMDEKAVLQAFGAPREKECYRPRCQALKVWHYYPPQCQEGLHLVLVDGAVAEQGYW